MKKEKTIHELVKEFPDKSYRELEKYRNELNEGEEQDNPALFKKEIDYHRYWKDMYEKEHKLRQEAEGETTIVKGIGISSPEMKEAMRTIKNLEIRLAESLEVNESHQKLNGKLQERLTELEEEIKKMHDTLNKKLESARKAGM